jgi:glutathione S-transferase
VELGASIAAPYVQRAVIALAEKGVLFERVYIDLANEPNWFLAISPFGKVPLLQVDDGVIFESAVILEYLEETQGNPLSRDAIDAERQY